MSTHFLAASAILSLSFCSMHRTSVMAAAYCSTLVQRYPVVCAPRPIISGLTMSALGPPESCTIGTTPAPKCKVSSQAHNQPSGRYTGQGGVLFAACCSQHSNAPALLYKTYNNNNNRTVSQTVCTEVHVTVHTHRLPVPGSTSAREVAGSGRG